MPVLASDIDRLPSFGTDAMSMTLPTIPVEASTTCKKKKKKKSKKPSTATYANWKERIGPGPH
jgi:hypothetical protein